jgi:tetratricopeptide (TPR) repeat protein
MDEKREVFICYAHEDESLRQNLEKHLRVLQRQNLITVWHDRKISPGTDWEQEINTALNHAHIILLLVSPDFMASDYCYGIEMQRAIQRHEQGTAKVLPIILRPVHWQTTPLGKLQALPADARPVVSSSWYTQDEAFYSVAEGVRTAIEELAGRPQSAASSEKRLLPQPAASEKRPLPQKSIEQLQGEGEVFYSQKQYEEALAAFEQAIRLDPSYAKAYAKKGVVLWSLKRYKEALVAFDQALFIEPEDGWTHSWKGAALYKLGRYEEALADREEALRYSGPDKPYGGPYKEDFYGKGEALYQLQRYEEAITALDQVIQLDPSFTNAYTGKAQAISQLRKKK